MTQAEPLVLVKQEQHICRVILNRPRVFNALNDALILELQRVFDALRSDTVTRVVIVEGAGGNFSSGADMAFLSADAPPLETFRLLQHVKHLLETMRDIPQPLVCKVEGVAYGAGTNLALTCDFVISADTARFCEVFINIGAGLDCGGTYFLPRLVGLSKARELALLGNEIDGQTAASLNLIYRSVPQEELESAVTTLTTALAQKSLLALSAIKHGLDKSFEMSLSEVLDWEASQQTVLLQSQEHKAAVRHFLESRNASPKEK